MKTIISICSARPNFVKLAAVHHAMKGQQDLKHVIVHTGQHYDPLFSDVFFEQLAIPTPDYNLGIHGGDRESTLRDTEEAMLKILPDIKPDLMLVYGDVNGALGSARAAKKYGCAIAHVEAGLRSFDDTMPEEHNRIEIDRMADLLLCSEDAGVQNLENEGLGDKARLVGNTMIDTLVRMLPEVQKADIPFDVPERYAVVTVHRPNNVDDPAALREVASLLKDVAAHIPIIIPMHHRLKAGLERDGLLEELSSFASVVQPLGYMPFIKLVSGSVFILTDSGGIQEEATYLQKLCFTLRKNTERPSTVESGSNRLVDPTKREDCDAVIMAAQMTSAPSIIVPSTWDGKAGERIVAAINS